MKNSIKKEILKLKPELEQLRDTVKKHKEREDKGKEGNLYDPEDDIKDIIANYLNSKCSTSDDSFKIILQRIIDEYSNINESLKKDTDNLKRQLHISCAIYLENIIKSFTSTLFDYINIHDGVRERLEISLRKDITGSAKTDNFKNLYDLIDKCLGGNPSFDVCVENYIHKFILFNLKNSGYEFPKQVKDLCHDKYKEKNGNKKNFEFSEYCNIFWNYIIEARDCISHGNGYNLVEYGGYLCLDAAEFVLKLSDCFTEIFDLY